MARLIWRRENLSTFRIAKLALLHEGREYDSYTETAPDLEELQAAQCAAEIKDEEDSARKQLGELYGLVAVGEVATIPYLERELRLQELLSNMIDKCMKRLIHAKGLNSISTVSPSASMQRLSAPPKAA